jgi:hypothetical protein
LNRYIDLYDAIEDIDTAAGFDNDQFENTDIPKPEYIALPESNFMSPEQRDQIRDWVLEVNTDGSAVGQLPERRCESCGTNMYESNL